MRTLDEPSISLDWYPMFREAAGIEGAPLRTLDGVSLLERLRGGEPPADRTLFWRFRDDLVGTPESVAARRGRRKYLRVGDTEALYDLEVDPGESRDLRGEGPEVLRELKEAVEGWEVPRVEWVSRGAG